MIYIALHLECHNINMKQDEIMMGTKKENVQHKKKIGNTKIYTERENVVNCTVISMLESLWTEQID